MIKIANTQVLIKLLLRMLQKFWHHLGLRGTHYQGQWHDDHGKDNDNDNSDDNDNSKDNEKDKDNDKDNAALIEVATTQVWGQACRRLPRLESPT